MLLIHMHTDMQIRQYHRQGNASRQSCTLLAKAISKSHTMNSNQLGLHIRLHYHCRNILCTKKSKDT